MNDDTQLILILFSIQDNVNELVLRRFLLTWMIYEHMKNVPLWKIADTFDVTRGFIQGLITSTGSFTFMLINFTKVRVCTK